MEGKAGGEGGASPHPSWLHGVRAKTLSCERGVDDVENVWGTFVIELDDDVGLGFAMLDHGGLLGAAASGTDGAAEAQDD